MITTLPVLRLLQPRLPPAIHLLKPPTGATRHLTTIISASYTPTPAIDRLISASSYTLPFFNALHYGYPLLAAYPSLSPVLNPIIPIFSLYRSLPYASFIAFFALYLVVVRNPILSHYVRFNAMQALVLDVLLALPLIFTRIFSPGRTGLGSRIFAAAHTALFLMMSVCFVYGVVSCILGRTCHIPFVGDAAARQLP